MAWRPSQALETLDFSASSASWFASSSDRLTVTRFFEGVTIASLCRTVLHHRVMPMQIDRDNTEKDGVQRFVAKGKGFGTATRRKHFQGIARLKSL